ncbi:MAG: YihY/virulence factor BrkB family protein [Chloroflexota bacterium]|jgi:membrane protein|nr:YihY/virulence factor BrkB family protein [Chloroflexota bacterium]
MKNKKAFQRIKKSLKAFYKKVNDFSGGVLEIIRSAFYRFGEKHGSEAAASLAYYAFFSIFPMLLVFIVVGSFFVDRGAVQTQLLRLLQGILPGVEDVIIANIERVLELRGEVTFIALISLIWSATSVFNILAKNINRAFPNAKEPDFFKGRMLGFFMFLALGLLMMLSFVASTIAGLIPMINIPFNDKALHETFIWQVGAFLVPVVINMLMFWAMYQWVPMVSVHHKAAFLGGLITGVAWEILNNGFTWYLSSGLSHYALVYGSVGTIVALLFYIYLTSMIVLIGAHLTASIHHSIIERQDDEQK